MKACGSGESWQEDDLPVACADCLSMDSRDLAIGHSTDNLTRSKCMFGIRHRRRGKPS